MLSAIVDVLNDMLAGVEIDLLATRSRSGIGRRVMYRCDETVVHTVDDIDPDEPLNMSVLLALDLTHVAPQSFRLNDAASKNM